MPEVKERDDKYAAVFYNIKQCRVMEQKKKKKVSFCNSCRKIKGKKEKFELHEKTGRKRLLLLLF